MIYTKLKLLVDPKTFLGQSASFVSGISPEEKNGYLVKAKHGHGILVATKPDVFRRY